MYVFIGTSDYLPAADKWLLYIYILHYFSKHFTRAIFVAETNSLAQIMCICKHEKRFTLIMNKMLVTFAFRPLAVFIHAFLHK